MSVTAGIPVETARQVLKGVVWMAGGAVALTIMAALIRLVSIGLPVSTMLFFRSTISLLIVLAWTFTRRRALEIRSRHRLTHFVRAVCGALSFVFLVFAYRRLDFALATALAYTTPFWVIILSVTFLGERPGLRRSVATLVGFIGVLIILKPLPLLDLGVMAALASAAFGACALSYVRWLSSRETTESMLFHFFMFGALLSAPAAIYAGELPSGDQLAMLGAISVAGTIGLGCAAHAYRLADATIIAPVDFLRLPVAGAIGIAFFGEIPQIWLVIGTVLMIAALYCIVTARRASPA